MEKYEPLEHLGTGLYKKSLKLLQKSDNKLFVSKEINYGSLGDQEKHSLVSQVNLLRNLKHPHILNLQDRIVDKQSQSIITISEFCEKGDLSQLLKRLKKNREYLPEETIWKYFMQLILALNEVHRNKTLHRNLKPSNVFLDSNDNIKLGDFGLIKTRESSTTTDYESSDLEAMYYRAPEQFEGNKYLDKSEVWACGCILYELCALVPPFVHSNSSSLALKIKTGKFERIPSRYSDELQRVIQWILAKSIEERPSVEELINIPNISMPLRDKRLKETKNLIQTKEDAIKKKAEELKILEQSLKAQEIELMKKESILVQQKRKIRDPPKTLYEYKAVRPEKEEAVVRNHVAPQYHRSKTTVLQLNTEPSLDRDHFLEANVSPVHRDFKTKDRTLNRMNSQDQRGFPQDGHFHREMRTIMKSLDNMIVSCTNQHAHSVEFEENEYRDHDRYKFRM